MSSFPNLFWRVTRKFNVNNVFAQAFHCLIIQCTSPTLFNSNTRKSRIPLDVDQGSQKMQVLQYMRRLQYQIQIFHFPPAPSTTLLQGKFRPGGAAAQIDYFPSRYWCSNAQLGSSMDEGLPPNSSFMGEVVRLSGRRNGRREHPNRVSCHWAMMMMPRKSEEEEVRHAFVFARLRAARQRLRSQWIMFVILATKSSNFSTIKATLKLGSHM